MYFSSIYLFIFVLFLFNIISNGFLLFKTNDSVISFIYVNSSIAFHVFSSACIKYCLFLNFVRLVCVFFLLFDSVINNEKVNRMLIFELISGCADYKSSVLPEKIFFFVGIFTFSHKQFYN